MCYTKWKNSFFSCCFTSTPQSSFLSNTKTKFRDNKEIALFLISRFKANVNASKHFLYCENPELFHLNLKPDSHLTVLRNVQSCLPTDKIVPALLLTDSKQSLEYSDNFSMVVLHYPQNMSNRPLS